jgi:hypothetical protein
MTMTKSKAKEVLKKIIDWRNVGEINPDVSQKWRAKGFFEGREAGVREAADVCMKNPFDCDELAKAILDLLKDKQ